MKPRHLENPNMDWMVPVPIFVFCYPRHRVSGTWQLFSAAVVETAPIGVFDVTSHNPHFRFSQSVLDHNAKNKGTLRRGVGSCHVGAGNRPSDAVWPVRRPGAGKNPAEPSRFVWTRTDDSLGNQRRQNWQL